MKKITHFLISITLAIVLSLFSFSVMADTSTSPDDGTLLFSGEGQMQCFNCNKQWVNGVSGPSVKVDYTVPPPGEGSFLWRTWTAPQDWSGNNAVQITTTNPSGNSVNLGLVLYDNATPAHSINASLPLNPGSTQSWTVLLNNDKFFEYMDKLPPGFAFFSKQTFDYTHVTAFQTFLPTSANLSVSMSSAQAVNYTLQPMIDSFGQYNKTDWTGKTHSVNDIIKTRQDEQAQLQPASPLWDKYGGSKNGPQLSATGHFRTAQVQGRWWLVTPEGHLFFSTAIGDIEAYDAWTVTGPESQRQALFESLPTAGDPLAQFSFPVGSLQAMNFYQANLFRADGSSWRTLWHDRTLARLNSWGFNTLGFNTNNEFTASSTKPYMNLITVTDTYGAGPNEPADTIPLNIGNLNFMIPDPFNPGYQTRAESVISSQIGACGTDPYCIGAFVDNELTWDLPWYTDYVIPRTVLKTTGTSAKAAFSSQLQAQYGTIDRLNAAWNLSLTSWNDFQQTAITLPTPLNAQQTTDASAFLSSITNQYFKITAAAFHKIAPNALYLGSRLAAGDSSGKFTPEVVKSAAANVDVISFNFYSNQLDPAAWSYTDSLGKPCMISEVAFAANDSGLFNFNLVYVPDQQSRATAYTQFVNSVLNRPAFVGVEWLRYMDTPASGGENGGENQNGGFVAINDYAYTPLVQAASSINRSIYSTLTPAPTPTPNPTPSPSINAGGGGGGGGGPTPISSPTPIPTPTAIVPLSTPTPTEIHLPQNIKNGQVIKFMDGAGVYLVKPDGLHPFDTYQSFIQYQKNSGQKLISSLEISSSYTINTTSAATVLAQGSEGGTPQVLPETLASGSLVNDQGTIYFISGLIKIPFTSLKVFTSLGYSLKNTIKGSSASYQLAQNYVINDAKAIHPWSSWLSFKGTIYYSTAAGMIPVPSWTVFISNAGQSKLVVPANGADISVIKKQSLEIMTPEDSRVIDTLSQPSS